MEQFSLESLWWTLKSMEQDRMSPSEKNIQNRIKEYLDIKINMDILTKRVLEEVNYERHYHRTPKFNVEKFWDKNKNVCSICI